MEIGLTDVGGYGLLILGTAYLLKTIGAFLVTIKKEKNGTGNYARPCADLVRVEKNVEQQRADLENHKKDLEDLMRKILQRLTRLETLIKNGQRND